MGAFSRSWEITKLSFGVIKKDRELLLFPLLAGIFSIIFIIALLFPTIISGLLAGESVAFTILDYVLLFIIYLGIAFIATFFNVCVVYTAKKRFEGGDSKFGEAINFAFSKIHLIFLWSLLAATVGLILRLMDNAAEKAGDAGKIALKILRSILGMVWSIITIFVVPAMVYHNLGPFAAIKKSVQVLRKTWGESLIRHYGLGLVQSIFIILGIILAVVLVIITLPLGGIVLGIVIVLLVLYFLAVILVFSIANSIFNTALYVFAESGQVPGGYNQEVLGNAFKGKKPPQQAAPPPV
jgi:hypothetical protein